MVKLTENDYELVKEIDIQETLKLLTETENKISKYFKVENKGIEKYKKEFDTRLYGYASNLLHCGIKTPDFKEFRLDLSDKKWFDIELHKINKATIRKWLGFMFYVNSKINDTKKRVYVINLYLNVKIRKFQKKDFYDEDITVYAFWDDIQSALRKLEEGIIKRYINTGIYDTIFTK